MVIQQGGTVDKNQAELTKGMKRDMIRFGVEYIMSENASDVIDIDIDKILKDGELKTAEENVKYAKLGESAMRNMTLEEASSQSLYQFEGIDFRTMQKKGSKNNDGLYSFRQRKAVQYIRPVAPTTPEQPKRNMQYLDNCQFYPAELFYLCDDNDRWIDMNTDTERKKQLMAKGFPNWKKSDMTM